MADARGALTGGSFGVAAPRASFIGPFIIALLRYERPRRTSAQVQTDPTRERKVSNSSLMCGKGLYDASATFPRRFERRRFTASLASVTLKSSQSHLRAFFRNVVSIFTLRVGRFRVSPWTAVKSPPSGCLIWTSIAANMT